MLDFSGADGTRYIHRPMVQYRDAEVLITVIAKDYDQWVRGIMDETVTENTDIALETPSVGTFRPPSITSKELEHGTSYGYYSPLPDVLMRDMSTECVLGVDEAGRGPVLGPMVYGVFYLPTTAHHTLLAEKHHFDDSKALSPAVRSRLMQTLCDPSSDLYQNCGWATQTLSARDISAGMLRPAGAYNLNAQAMDATIELINGVLARKVNVREIYIDTIGAPAVYQRKLETIFPTISITVAKKADSLYPCVSAASVCAKVTRDAALEVLYESYLRLSHQNPVKQPQVNEQQEAVEGWGSGYPSDVRCSSWLKQNMNPVFGWGSECRFSWGTAKDILEDKNAATQVDWPVHDDEDVPKMTDFFTGTDQTKENEFDRLRTWYGKKTSSKIF